MDYKLILRIIGIALILIPFSLLTYFDAFPLCIMFIGYVLYIVGRGGENSGLILLSSLLVLSGALMWLGYIKPSWHFAIDLSINLPLFVCGGFGLLTGVLGFLDGIRMSNAEYALLKKRMGPKSQPTYPKDLITKYRRRYPHNPKGVLRWHIDKKMKEGKTREQAIKELVEGSE